MLHDAAVVRTVAAAIDSHGFKHVVLDPVMVTTTVDRLIEDATLDALVSELFPSATLITPNLDEAGVLLGRPLSDVDQLKSAVRDLANPGARAVLLRGGPLPGNEIVRGPLSGWWHRSIELSQCPHSVRSIVWPSDSTSCRAEPGSVGVDGVRLRSASRCWRSPSPCRAPHNRARSIKGSDRSCVPFGPTLQAQPPRARSLPYSRKGRRRCCDCRATSPQQRTCLHHHHPKQ